MDRALQIAKLYAEARGLREAERDAFLRDACANDSNLLREVQALLDAVAELPSVGTTLTEPGDDSASIAAGWERLKDRLAKRASDTPRYEKKEEVARGGMGAIHEVWDEELRRTLAMKVILARDGEVRKDSLGRFLEEAQITGQLDHPGVVPVHELGLDAEDRVFFTMKMVKGSDLREIFDLVRHGQEDWTVTRALGVLLKVCEAMAYAHSKGVIHRDLKPANVMVGRFGEVYVMDWGLARALGKKDSRDLRWPKSAETMASVRTDRREEREATPDTPLVTMDGTVVGTPAYMPPEQAEGRIEEMGPPADVYAMGAMLYHLMTGHMPYVPVGSRKSSRMILMEVTHGPPPSIAAATDAPPELVAICEKAMERDIAARYPDMTALASDLRAFLENRVVAAHETGAVAELRKWIVRNQALAATAATALVAVMALAGWALEERSRAREEARRADENAETATRRADDVLRLSDARRLGVLKVEAERLWPADPELLPAMDSWLAEARALLANLPAHEGKLAELRATGAARAAAPGNLAGSSVDADRLEIAREYDFGEDVDAGWWHDALRDLVLELHAFGADDRFSETMASVTWRRDYASTVKERTLSSAEAEEAWAEARAAVRSHPKYGGLDLPPQLGLLPLGPDPESALWEFWHVASGAQPERDKATGRWTITSETALVLVLIPGGKFWMGAQKTDEDGPNFDLAAVDDESDAAGMPVEVTLSAYFLSKYELTQGQWERMTGDRPSQYGQGRNLQGNAASLSHPVERVSWEDGTRWFPRYGLQLPTESQWEYGARGGTGTVWWTGDDPSVLDKAGNLADAYCRENGGPASWSYENELNDGYMAHAPVGRFRANGFGLHDVIGNVWEWCADGYSSHGYDHAVSKSDAASRVSRGGSWVNVAVRARSAIRDRDAPDARFDNLGLRPARNLITE